MSSFPKVEVKGLYKVFGKNPKKVISRLNEGQTREEIIKKTGNVPAVIDASFKANEGEIFIVMGLSGSGKSTLVRCINRLFEASSGSILIDGEDVLKAGKERLREIRRTKISMVFQHFALLPHKTVIENVEYGLLIRGEEKHKAREKAKQTLDSVGLGDWGERLTSDLSGGMQQRVGLARALANDPDILLMDEPFSALDPLIRRDMQDELINLQREMKKTIIFITHDLNEALKLGDQIAVMKDGQIVQIGNAEEIVSRPANDYVAAFTSDINRGLVFTASSIMRKADTLTIPHDSVKTASIRIRKIESDAMYVLDRENKPVGLVTDYMLGKAIENGVKDLSSVFNKEFPHTDEDTSLTDVLTMCHDFLPIAITNKEGKLVGVVEPLDVINVIGGKDDESLLANNNSQTPTEEK